jgi:hypothetical protein
LRAAPLAKPETFIIGRTDAYRPLGLDAAMRRAERFLKLGAEASSSRAFRDAFCSAAIRPGSRRPNAAASASPRYPIRKPDLSSRRPSMGDGLAAPPRGRHASIEADGQRRRDSRYIG